MVASRASPSTRATTASAPRILSVPPRDVERLVARAVHRFDPATGAWEALADMPIELTGHRAVAMGPDIYVVGGFPDVGRAATGVCRSPVRVAVSAALKR